MGEAGGAGDEGSGRLALLAACAAVCAVLLGLSTNVASSLVPENWAERHAAWVWAATALLAVASVSLSVLAWRHGAAAPRRDIDARGSRPEARNAEVVGGGATVERSVDASGTSGPVVVAGAGATVTLYGAEAEPAPAARAGQIVAGELPGRPPAFVDRQAVERLGETLEQGANVAVVSALTGGRGIGKTQVAAQYARHAVATGVQLVAWVPATDRERMLGGLAAVADRIGVADPEGDSEVSATRLREVLAARTSVALLVFDDAKDPQLVRRYVPATGATQVVVTTTDRAFTSLGTEVPVGTFEPHESIAYLAERTELDDPIGAKAVADELGHLPLALAQAATVIRLRSRSYSQYLDAVRSLPLDEILPAGRGDAYPHGTAEAILLSVEAVEEASSGGLLPRVLRALAVLGGDGVTTKVLKSVVGLENGDDAGGVDDALALLAEASLVVWARDRDAVVMHRLVARALRDRSEHSGDLSSVLQEIGGALRPLLIREDQAWNQRDAAAEMVSHVASLWEIAVRAAQRDALSSEELAAYAPLAQWAVRHLRVTADLSRAIQTGVSVLATAMRILGGDHLATMTSRHDLAHAYFVAGDPGRSVSLLEETVTARERVLGADHPDTLSSRNNLASANRRPGT